MNIVDSFSRDDLKASLASEPWQFLYDTTEKAFLSTYAPRAFSGQPIPFLKRDWHLEMELLLEVFDVTVKLDVSVARGKRLESLASEKAARLNPVLASVGMDKIELSDTPLATLLDMKNQGLEYLRRATEHTPFRTTYSRSRNTDRFQKEREELIALFGDVPMLVYGSAVSKPVFSDIDTLVVLPESDPDLYKRIVGKTAVKREIPLSFVTVPKQFFHAYSLSDPSQNCASPSSLILNGYVTVPLATDAYKKDLCLHRIAAEYVEARTILNPEGFARCENIIHRVNSKLTLQKFIHKGLQYVAGKALPEPNFQKWASIPSEQEFFDAMLDANIYINGLLKEVYSSISVTA